MTTKEKNKSSDFPPPTSFSSLPDEIVLNCLARVSRFYYPTLSLVCKGFRSLLDSRELHATRSCIGKTESFLYVCLDLHRNCYPDCPPRWFIVSPITKQKLKPIPSITSQSSTVVSIGSKIYIIGGFVDGQSSRRLIVLDCPSHGWRRLPEMRVPRQNAAADVINGKIYVIGGSSSNNIKDWGEVYDPKNQTWEPLFPTTLDLTVQMSVVPGVLVWCEPEEDRGWCPVDGLEGLPNRPTSPGYLTSVAHSDRGRRVTVWWESVLHRLGPIWTKECKTEIWCAEISFERRGVGKVCGFVEWSKNVFTKDDYKTYKLPASLSDFFLNSTILTY
ncbi:unnamed protein product [Arabidopsis thaliana]|uniref:F-box domain-containing protein n=1 Tax=Arabidopsis thaliana TaxID=3702 RepID=A0A5S9XI88_ARATH|nr:unnamed protein product [Arabidopsis thaliana]